MAKMVGNPKDIAAVLNELIELEVDAVEAYQTAIERLDDDDDKAHFKGFLGDHIRHVRELEPLVVECGEVPIAKADVKQILTKGKLVLAGLIGDRLVLMAMKTNEDHTNKAYDLAVGRDDLPAHVHDVLLRNLDDERLHREYIVRRLDVYAGKRRDIGDVRDTEEGKPSERNGEASVR